MDESRKYHAMCSRQAEITRELTEMAQHRKGLTQETEALKPEISRLKKLLAVEREKETSTKPLAVSDHAVLRFMERAMGFDIKAVRERILSPVVREALEAGATRVKSEGFDYVLDKRIVVTVID